MTKPRIGLMKGTMKLSPHDKRWSELFEEGKKTLLARKEKGEKGTSTFLEKTDRLGI